MKIDKLTSKQEAAIPTHREKWVGIGLSTENPTFERTKEIVHTVQRDLLERKTTHVVMGNNPFETWVIVCGMQTEGAKLADLSQDELTAMAVNMVAEYKANPVQLPSLVWPRLGGAFEAGALAYYDFWREMKIVKLDEKLLDRLQILLTTAELGVTYPLEHICVVCKKPHTIHVNENGLHKDGGPALEYEDWPMWSLNGVAVPEYLVMTPSGKLDIAWYQTQTNADVKAEFVRKYGVERMLDLGKRVDTHENYDEKWWTKSQYELWDMSSLFDGVEYQPFLKMLNQTTGIWHVEAVSPECRTLAEAIKERFGGQDFQIVDIA